jgi:hypothetical protein
VAPQGVDSPGELGITGGVRDDNEAKGEVRCTGSYIL